jgi:CheY-like chemotaxis protein
VFSSSMTINAVLKSTIRMLDILGYTAISAASGAEALPLVASEIGIDLVLTDVAMPEIARAIHVARPTLPLVLLAGYFDHNVLEKFDEVSILQKPYTEDDLIKSIRATLHQGSC